MGDHRCSHPRGSSVRIGAGRDSSSPCSLSTIAPSTRRIGPRSKAGHWEGDLIIAKQQSSAIGTLVERQTRATRLLHLPQRHGDALHDALATTMAGLPPGLVRSISWDQGSEMARHRKITRILGAPVFFCDSHSPWQRGTNENTNGLLRDYFPKGTELSAHSIGHLHAVEYELNDRPRAILNGQSPMQLFPALLELDLAGGG